AGNSEARQRRPHEVRDDAEVFGDDVAPGRAKDGERVLAKGVLLRLVGGPEEGPASAARAAVRAVEADEVIDAVAVVQVGAPTRPRAEPGEPVGRGGGPVVEGHPPVLTGCAESVRRYTNRNVEPEVLLQRPHVGAVRIDHERQV